MPQRRHSRTPLPTLTLSKSMWRLPLYVFAYLYMCLHASICVLKPLYVFIPLCVCPHTSVCVSACLRICAGTAGAGHTS
jgi:hypothetical protein